MRQKIFYRFMPCLVLLVFFSCTKSCDKSSPVAHQEIQQEEQPAEARVFFEEPNDGEKTVSPVGIKMGVEGMTVRPALEDVNDRSSGHHHILIDHPLGFIEEGQVIPVDPRHIHYGQGQSHAAVELEPGLHTLTLQFANGAHLSYGKKMAATITITVLPTTDATP